MRCFFSFTMFFSFIVSASAQSFNTEKTSMINYVKRMYSLAPFEGAKLIEGDNGSYYVVAITIPNNSNSIDSINNITEIKAQDAAKITFAEPCIKFEMLSTISDDEKKVTTYLFSCEPLSEFIKTIYAKQAFDGAKIIATPKNNYFISVIALDSKKYTNESLKDRVALIKAKQQVNTLFNGSVISSDVIIKTEEKTGIITSTEIIREQSMGFVEGLETLAKFSSNEKSVYIFYNEITNKRN